MHYSFFGPSLAGLVLFSPVFANPTTLESKSGLGKRQTISHCTDNESDNPIPGNLVCFSSDGFAMTCDECLGNDGNVAATHAGGDLCFIINTTDNGQTTDQTPTACPGDPPPTTNPDGTDGSTVATGIMDAYCAAAGEGGLFGWLSFAACYAYTWAQAGNEDFEAGVESEYCVTLVFFSLL
jgi:hypothetical protein